jgi:hypothetical protein
MTFTVEMACGLRTLVYMKSNFGERWADVAAFTVVAAAMRMRMDDLL